MFRLLLVFVVYCTLHIIESTSCATANIGKFEKFSGSLLSQNDHPHHWEIKYVELAEDLIYNVEIINGDNIPLLLNEHTATPPPMIFVHGWMDSRLNWMTLIPHILNTVSPNQIIIIPTLRGHGDSQIFPLDSSQFDYDEYVEDIRLLLQTLGFTSKQLVYNLVGHSMGGGIAMQMVINHPNMIHKVVFMDAVPAFEIVGFAFDADKNEPTYAQLRQMIKTFNYPQYEKGWISKNLCNIIDRENLKVNSMAARKSYYALTTRNNTDALVQMIETFDIKSMVLFGEYDFVPAETQKQYAQKISAKVVQYKDCGHDPHTRYPQQVADEILQFFSDDESVQKQDL